MEKGEEQSSKKARVESPMVQVKEEALDGDEATGEDALVSVEAAARRTRIMVSIDMAMLHCPICMHPLKPPIFQCADGHPACGTCHGQLRNSRCYACSNDAGNFRNIGVEDIVRSTKIQCLYSLYGCPSCVTYYDADDHQAKCAHAPCRCSEPGCAFVGSPTMLRDHLRDTHSWPVDSIRYGRPHHVQLPESSRRLLEAEEDGRVFVVSVASSQRCASVSLACVRACGAAAAGPHYTCKMWATGSAAAATGKVPTVFVEMEVPSSAVPGQAAAADDEEGPALVVQRRMLHGPSKELHLSVKIDKVQA